MSLADNRSRRSRRGRPKNTEREITVVDGKNLQSWGVPGRSTSGKFPWEYLTEDDLASSKGYKIYREIRNDDQVKACLWLKKALILGRSYDVVPADEGGNSKEVAEFVKKALDRVKIIRQLWEALGSAFDYGFCVGELIWEYEDDGSKVWLKDIKFRNPESMNIEVDIHGNIVRFRQEPELHPMREIPIAPSKIFHYAYQSEFGNPYGKSDMRGIYRAWWSKKYITQFYNVFLERFGQPLMMMKYPQGSSAELKSALRGIMSNLSAKSDILVPEGVIIELIEATRAGTARYDEALWYYDTAIAKGLVVPALLGMGGSDVKRGSDSQSRLHLRTLMKLVKFIGDDVFDALMNQVVKQLVDANFDVKEYPKLIWQDYGEFEAFEITDAIKELFNAGILDVDQEDINYARGILGLPLRDEGEEDKVNRPDPSMMTPGGGLPGGGSQAKPGGQAGQGNDRAKGSPSTNKTERSTGQRRT